MRRLEDRLQATGVATNGIGQKTTNHLNLTKTMEAQVAQEAADRASHVHWSTAHRKAKGNEPANHSC